MAGVMQLGLLYWVLLESMLASFSGLSSLPVIRHELVEQRHWIDDRELNAAVMIGRSTPGPMGVYVVCVGYFVAGYPGAAVGMLAMATPALLILVLLRVLREDPRLKNAVRYVVLAGSAYSLAALVGMSGTALTTWWAWGIGFVSAALLLRTRVATGWIVLGAGVAGVMLK